jgi:hypothetical protein
MRTRHCANLRINRIQRVYVTSYIGYADLTEHYILH